jgi:hypothetical protein
VGLHRTAGHILGVDPKEEPPRLALSVSRRIAGPYVCIATKSSCQAKFWNNGHGWNMVVGHLKSLGYRVLAIDREATVGLGFTWNQIPHEAEDFTGNLPLAERIALLRHADFFIGLGSGLSWLAWACKIPVILISGFSLPNCEFETPYRVYSAHGCKGCWDDTAVNFDHRDFLWCPRHKGTERQYECTRLITGQQVIGHIDRLMLDHGLAPQPRVRVTALAGLGNDITSIDREGGFAAVLTRLARDRKPETVIETGAYHATGTTAAVLRGLKESGHACRFFSLEVNPEHCRTARHNLERSGDLERVTLLNGLSLPRNMLPTREALRRDLADAALEPGLFVDFPENIRADAYHEETNFPDAPDDLLGQCLAECGDAPGLVILDSGGHIGFTEFAYVLERLRGPCVIALDDTLHVKHRESLRRI